jgi:hypothetical protein
MKSCQIRHSESHGRVDVVYSAALRQVHNPHWAQEVPALI